MKQMKKTQAYIWLVAALLILGLLGYYAATIIMGTIKGEDKSLKLGLDLAGGVSITYQVVGDNPTDEQINDTINKLQQRIENDLGQESATTEASVYKVGDDRITVEIPGVHDANAMLEELGTPGTLYFIAETDSEGNTNYTYDSSVGDYVLLKTIDELTANGSIVCTGTDVGAAQAGYEQNQTTGAQKAVVSLTLTDAGAKAFGDATTRAFAAGETIGIYYDGKFVSVPRVNAAITNGNCIIEGMGSFEAADKLASYIRIGGLDVQLEELQSEVVGAQLGSNALATSLMAAGIGLALVMLFLIIMYLLPGAAAAISLGIYTALMIAVLYWYDITLTLPGIAGMILSIGMAVDANVIVFARIREEIAAGRSVATSMEAGYQKAFSAIFDGNITTLIAAAVLGALGSGSVKGFATTLAIGVLLSMFTALVVCRILNNALYGVGLKDAKLYGKAKERKTVKFIENRKKFFAVSLIVIIAGFVFMGINAGSGKKSLNYSLEFLGGTSTTVGFDKAYTIDELDSEVVPVVAAVTGDNAIQTTTVDGSNQVIFKTRSLSLEERTELATAMEEKFGVAEESITSTNISSTISGEMRRQSIIAVVVAAICMLLYIWFRFKDIRFASSAIIALIHDVLVVLALYAIARISVGSAFVACMLTVIGYSVNDTIVIFDRIRENMKSVTKVNEESYTQLANNSLTQTLSRSISTSITTAIMVLMLLILGVSTIREFALPLLAGVITGTYSSICIATQLWYVMKMNIKSKDAKATSKNKK